MEVSNINVNFWMKNAEDCLDLVNREWKKIPLVNANEIQDLQDGKLVRFIGMVQDMYNPEYYFEKYEVVDEATAETSLRNGKYLDTADCTDKEVINFDSDKNVTSERHTFVLISMPGLNTWVENIDTDKNKPLVEKTSASISPAKTKRSLDDNTETEATNASPATSSVKKQCVTPAPAATQPVVSQDHLLNFPLPGRNGKACHLKLYGAADTIKLNDLVDCVGFLSVNPVLSQAGLVADEDNGDSPMELQTHNPPPSLVPRIHCVGLKKIKNYNPLGDDCATMTVENMQFLKKELHIVLMQLLLGDGLAAEYLIYHLLSKVYLRRDLMALGKFTLNISNIPTVEIPNYGERLYEFLEELVPKSHYLPMTLNNMNDLSFIPKKDYDCNRITSGILQLSENTHLVLDETKMSPGKLNESGVKAIGAISNAIKHQKTPYDFNYYQMEFDCDIPFLVLSEGKSLLPSDSHVRLKIDDICLSTFDEITEAAKVYLKPELLDSIRKYLSIQRHAEYELSSCVEEAVQAEFVNMRRANNATADDLHNLLVLARLVCLADGKSVLDDACWKRACLLETERKERLPKS